MLIEEGPSVPNFEAFAALRDCLKTIPATNIRMDKLLLIDRDRETLAEAVNPACGTVGCIAGWGACFFGSPEQVLVKIADAPIGSVLNFSSRGGKHWEPTEITREALGLNYADSSYVFYAAWAVPGNDSHTSLSTIRHITGEQVIQYLDKVIAEQNVRVTI